uniref:MAPK regulated corepressor interacting protein 2 n=1 Tax=Serinus canaria TaxID=9135 RepID=A0A8C9NG76_SERCA
VCSLWGSPGHLNHPSSCWGGQRCLCPHPPLLPSLHSPAQKLVFNRVNGKRPPLLLQQISAPEECYTLAHEENVRFVYEAWQQVEQQLDSSRSGESACGPVQYVEKTPNPGLKSKWAVVVALWGASGSGCSEWLWAQPAPEQGCSGRRRRRIPVLDVPEGLVGSVLLVLRSLCGCWREMAVPRHCGGDVLLHPFDVPLCC